MHSLINSPHYYTTLLIHRQEFETVIGKSGESSSRRLPYEAGLAYDTAVLLLDVLHKLLLRDDYDRAALQATFTANLSSLLRQSDTYGVTVRGVCVCVCVCVRACVRACVCVHSD